MIDLSFNLKRRLTAAMMALVCAFMSAPLAARAAASPRVEPASLGILLPISPRDYHIVFDNMHVTKKERFGPFQFVVGTILGVPSVVIIPPIEGVLVRSLAAHEMLHHYNIKAILYPGTSGAHLDTDQMRVGDVVLGAENVDFGNFFITKTGELAGSQFVPKRHYAGLYADPRLLAALACAASHVVAHTMIPGWLDPDSRLRKPDIFYYGIQGTSEMWVANRELMSKLRAAFHEVDEDGDWYSALVATLYNVPFIEVSTISDSIFQFPDTERGVPKTPGDGAASAGLIAQTISNEVMIDLIKRDGARILRGRYNTPTTSPFPESVFDQPKQAGTLLAGCPA